MAHFLKTDLFELAKRELRSLVFLNEMKDLLSGKQVA